MNAAAGESKLRWTWAALGAVTAVAAVASLFRLPPAALPVPTAAAPVEIARVTPADAALIEATLMRDLTPLFLPTPRNATVPPLRPREPGKAFLNQEAIRLSFAETAWSFERDWPPAVTLDGRVLGAVAPLDVLEGIVPSAALPGMGRKEVELVPLPPRAGFVEVVSAQTGERVLAEPLDIAERPAKDRLWAPVEYIAAVTPAGLAVPLALVTRSGVEEVDSFFRDYLARVYRIGERLPPGFYRITVAP